jgi:hypothetical protein
MSCCDALGVLFRSRVGWRSQYQYRKLDGDSKLPVATALMMGFEEKKDGNENRRQFDVFLCTFLSRFLRLPAHGLPSIGRHRGALADKNGGNERKVAPKTYLERRSWLHPIRSFQRIYEFMLTMFYLTCVLAWQRVYENWLPPRLSCAL